MPRFACPLLIAPAQALALCHDAVHGMAFEVPLEDLAHAGGLFLVDDEPAVLQVIAKRQMAAGPLAALARQDLFVAGTFRDDLPFELSEREQDVQR